MLAWPSIGPVEEIVQDLGRIAILDPTALFSYVHSDREAGCDSSTRQGAPSEMIRPAPCVARDGASNR